MTTLPRYRIVTPSADGTVHALLDDEITFAALDDVARARYRVRIFTSRVAAQRVIARWPDWDDLWVDEAPCAT